MAPSARRPRRAPRSPAARTPAPPHRVPVTAPRVAPAVRRPRASHTSTTTHALATPIFSRFSPRPAILRHDPGLAASPPVRYTLKRKRSSLLSSYRARCTDKPFAKRRRAAYWYAGRRGSPWVYGCSCGTRSSFTRFSKGRLECRRARRHSRGVVNAPHESWASSPNPTRARTTTLLPPCSRACTVTGISDACAVIGVMPSSALRRLCRGRGYAEVVLDRLLCKGIPRDLVGIIRVLWLMLPSPIRGEGGADVQIGHYCELAGRSAVGRVRRLPA